MIATILENPRRSKRSHKRGASGRVRLGTVGKARKRRRSTKRGGFGAWVGSSRRHAKASRKGWAKRRRGVSLAIAPNPRKRSRRKSPTGVGLAENPRRMRRVSRRGHRRGLGSPLIPTSDMLESTALAIVGATFALKGGNYLNKVLGCSTFGGVLSGNIGEYLTAFGATVLGTMAVERFSTKERADAVQLGGLFYIGLKALGSLVGVSITEGPSCGHFLGLGDYKRISGMGEENPYQLEEVSGSEAPAFAGMGAYERVIPPTTEFYPSSVTGVV